MMKKLSLFIILVIILGCFSGCGGNNAPLSEVEEASKAVTEALEGIKNFDIDKICRITGSDKSEYDGIGREYREFAKNTFGKLRYTITSTEKKDDDTVVVKATVTAVDITVMVSQTMSEILSNPDGIMGKTQDEIAQVILAQLTEISKDENPKTVTNDIEVDVNKKDNKWVPDFDDEDLNAVFGNLDKVANLFVGPEV